MTTLTLEQRKLLSESGAEILHLVDPDTQQQYVLMRADVYDQLRGGYKDLEPRELYPALHEALRDEGWDEPQMEEYNRYGEPRTDCGR